MDLHRTDADDLEDSDMQMIFLEIIESNPSKNKLHVLDFKL